MKKAEGTEANCTIFGQLILSIEAKVQTIEASRIRHYFEVGRIDLSPDRGKIQATNQQYKR